VTPVTSAISAAATQPGTFKRSEFGMKYGLPAALGDEVKLWMSFYGFRD
jgi:polyisoprenoid-binding protein YceI